MTSSLLQHKVGRGSISSTNFADNCEVKLVSNEVFLCYELQELNVRS